METQADMWPYHRIKAPGDRHALVKSPQNPERKKYHITYSFILKASIQSYNYMA